MKFPNSIFLEEQAQNNTVIVTRILEVMKEEFITEMEVYLSYMSNENYTEASKVVHKLKHKASLLNLDKEKAIELGKYEMDLLSKDLTLKDEFDEILDKISRYFKNL